MNDRTYEKSFDESDEKVNHTGNNDGTKEEQSEREEVDDDKDLDSCNLANPLPPPNVDLDKLRGDRIGDTVYSGKWCIQTVIKLMQSNVVAKSEDSLEADEKIELVDMEEELQNEVGVLWDMTSNVEVCQYLHSISAIESICYVINNSRCPRATEMCVGMLANIITHKELWEILKNDTLLFDLLIQLLSNTDQPVLLEVTRFLNTALCHPDNECCYARLCENGQNVTCELLRILSGSTNADLLKHAAELTYNLMYIDEGETNFCAFFASDPEFVLAVIEASKELGYEHDSSGQNYLMEIFHCFTTYDAGILAIENCMEEIAETSSAYLKSLCKNVNLNSNSTIITTIIATLNHIFCRNVMVRLGLMSSPTFAHCVLKTLVSVYRKLGCYRSIAYSKHSLGSISSDKYTGSSSSWQAVEDSFTGGRPGDTSSWSERAANAASSSQSAKFRTPDPSPVHHQRVKDMEVSWSERRISSPLADDDLEETWKRPLVRKRLRKKRASAAALDADSGGNQRRSTEAEGKESGSSVCHSKVTDDIAQLATDDIEQPAESQVNPKKIEDRSRHDPDEGRDSKGFSPQADYEDMETEREKAMCESEVTSRDERGVNRNGGSGATDQDAVAPRSLDVGGAGDGSRCLLRGQQEGEEGQTSGVHASIDKDDDDDDEEHNDDEDELMHSFDGSSGDKYHKLLSVIGEFLMDYLNNMRETVCSDDGTPCISSLITYLDTQCSGTEIRALVKVVGTSTDPGTPLGRLLHLSDHFKASKLKSVILGAL